MSIIEYCLMIFAAFWAWIVWGETINGTALIGMVMIIASGAVISLRSSQAAPDEVPARP